MSQDAIGSWPAFDDHGNPIVPSNEHVLDRLLVEASLRESSHYGTVAVVWTLPQCDLCRCLARYDSELTLRGGDKGWANLCIEHAWKRGSKMLGRGISQYLMLAAEVSDGVRHDFTDQGGPDPAVEEALIAPWIQTYRRIGFGGPDAAGVMGREILGKSIIVSRAGPNAIEWRIRAGAWESQMLGDEDYRVPDVWTVDQVRHALRDRLGIGRSQKQTDLVLTLEEAERITRTSLDSGVYRGSMRDEIKAAPPGNYLFWDGLSWQRCAAELAAKGSPDAELVDRLAVEHPDTMIRMFAVANAGLTAEGQMAMALQEGRGFGRFLLRRSDVAQSVVDELTEQAVSGTFTSGADRELIFWVALHPATPEKHLPALAERIRASGAEPRVRMAAEARDLPQRRRHVIYTQLLKRSRHGKASARTIDAMIGLAATDADHGPVDLGAVDHDEVAWLLAHEDRKVAYVARARLDELGLLDGPEPGSSPSAPELPGLAVDPTDDLVFGAEPAPPVITGESVAARLRRAWISEIGPWLESIRHDLSDCWQETTLVRRGMILDLLTPIDFGDGDPFAGGVGKALELAVTKASSGRVNQIRWRHARAARPLRSGESRGTDIFHAGDPTDTNLVASAAAISKRLKGVTRADAREALNCLVVAGESTHRIWLAVASVGQMSAIGSVPDAGGVLFEAIRKYQGKPKPLYTIVADEFLASVGSPLRVP